MKNKIQNYKWGSINLMQDHLGIENPNNEHQAELWMGAHEKASSEIEISNTECLPLKDYIENSHSLVLGDKNNFKFEGRLPYLFKVLAVDKPLSIQAHPDKAQAVEGFKRENDLGIPLNNFKRNYKDKNHKPEILCAITEFTAMSGFRDINQIIDSFSLIEIPEIKTALSILKKETSDGLKNFVETLLQLKLDDKSTLIDKAINVSEKNGFLPNQNRWIVKLNNEFPSDAGSLAPLLLNIISLKPGEAIYLPARQLHAYLEGFGIELMANSDNVLRGGLTQKNIDIPELLSVLDFVSFTPKILKTQKISSREKYYKTPTDEFLLSKICLNHDEYNLEESTIKAIEPSIFFCLKGEVTFIDFNSNEEISIKQGESLFADFQSKLLLKGNGKIYRASVPII